MTQRDLDLAVARVTGENVCEIHRRGFSLADPLDVDFDPEPNDLPPQSVDWDALDLRRNVDVVSYGLHAGLAGPARRAITAAPTAISGLDDRNGTTAANYRGARYGR